MLFFRGDLLLAWNILLLSSSFARFGLLLWHGLIGELVSCGWLNRVELLLAVLRSLLRLLLLAVSVGELLPRKVVADVDRPLLLVIMLVVFASSCRLTIVMFDSLRVVIHSAASKIYDFGEIALTIALLLLLVAVALVVKRLDRGVLLCWLPGKIAVHLVRRVRSVRHLSDVLVV